MAKQNTAEDNSTPTGANKFSVYAKRNAASRVDWETIAGDISTEIKATDDERKEQKAAIDESQTEALKQVAKVGDLNGVRLNEEVIEASNQSSEVLQIAFRNLKSGAISHTQYKMIMQRQKNNYSELSSAAKNYSTWFTAQQERNAKEGGSNLEETIGNGTAGFGNLDNKKIWVDPVSGSIMLVTMQTDKEGNIVMPNFKDNPEFFQNISAINNRYNFKEDRKILSEETAALVDPLKDVITSIATQSGSVRSFEDLRQDPDFDKIIVDNVAALTSTGNDVAQILTGQTIGSPYQLAESLDEFKRKYPDLGEEYFIKYVMDNGVGVAQPTGAQLQEAKDRAERSLESQIDSIVKATAQFRPTPKPKDVRDAESELEAKTNVQKTWNSIKGQSPTERIASFESLIGSTIGQRAGLVGVNPSEDGTSISFVYTNEKRDKNRTIKIDGNITDQEWAIIGNEITGMDSPMDAYNAGGFATGEDGSSLPYSFEFGDAGANREGNLKRFDAELSAFISDGFPDNENDEPFLDQSDKKVAAALNQRYSEYGLKAVATGIGPADNTRVTIEGWKGNEAYPSSFDLDSDITSDANALEAEDEFKKWLRYVLEKTGQVEKMAEIEGFSGKTKANDTKSQAEQNRIKAEEDAKGSTEPVSKRKQQLLDEEAKASKYGPCVNGLKTHLTLGTQIAC